MNIINTYLKAKHWQLFLIFFAPFALWQTISFSFLYGDFSSLSYLDQASDKEVLSKIIEIFGYFKYFMFFIILISLIIVFWNWSVTIGLQHKIPEELRINIKRFKIFFFVPIIYGLILSAIVINFVETIPEYFFLIENGELTEADFEDKLFSLLKFVPIFFLAHFFTVFCSFHTIYCTAKTIKLVELKRKLKFDNFIGEFFLTWFYFIGIWILQPKINKLAEEHDNELLKP